MHVKFPPVEEPGLKVTTGSDGESISLSTQKPIKGIILEVDGEEVRWNDQAIDLILEDLQKKKSRSMVSGRSAKVQFLGDGTA